MISFPWVPRLGGAPRFVSRRCNRLSGPRRLQGPLVKQEVPITARLQHPHILPLYDSGDADSRLFYVMPYVDGESPKDGRSRTG